MTTVRIDGGPERFAPEPGTGPATNPEVTVYRLIGVVRTLGVHPAVAANFVNEGVLHDLGWALWETIRNPNTGRQDGGGYNHALLHVVPSVYVSDRPSPGLDDLSGIEVLQLQTIVRSWDVNFIPAEWPEYAADATAITAQNMVLSPVDLGGGRFTFYRYPELRTLVSLARGAGIRIYANVGVANSVQF